MFSKKVSMKCFFASTFIFMMFPRQSRLVSLKIFKRSIQDTVSNTSISYPNVLSDVEVFEIPSKEVKTQTIVIENDKSERGFDLTKEEMEKFKIWPYGIIPFYIDNFSFDTFFIDRLRTLLNSVSTVTGLRFMELTEPPKDDHDRWVFFMNRRGMLNCEDYTTSSFTNVGVQQVVLGYDCLGGGGGALAATVLALAGVPPQHNAPDRDEHIKVIMDNIIPGKRNLFQVLKDDEWLFHDVGYDFLSAGHFDFHKYTFNGSATIIPKDEVTVPVGEGDGISNKDVSKIQMLYNFIKRRSPKAKASDCSKLYKPAANFHEFDPPNYEVNIIPRSKPLKYLKDSGNNKINLTAPKIKTFNNNKYSKLKKSKKVDKLGMYLDHDTDE